MVAVALGHRQTVQYKCTESYSLMDAYAEEIHKGVSNKPEHLHEFPDLATLSHPFLKKKKKKRVRVRGQMSYVQKNFNLRIATEREKKICEKRCEKYGLNKNSSMDKVHWQNDEKKKNKSGCSHKEGKKKNKKRMHIFNFAPVRYFKAGEVRKHLSILFKLRSLRIEGNFVKYNSSIFSICIIINDFPGKEKLMNAKRKMRIETIHLKDKKFDFSKWSSTKQRKNGKIVSGPF
ncbi:hypothetical protein POVCU2_0044470 [Plasmodium ovale curtisi]|uniref:Uncharacterized protein n=1 Tax=Plasmodium ovale curtisi TaxID=864141 RepID=A0A1A8W4D1_PLAOA|nr:hypothetical protein POVCU2_0044470 [Plasmodium ovale curtisi]SBS97793.1 hypothetical protein POVCU1_041040 [Plasmodium ovale curtisi]